MDEHQYRVTVEQQVNQEVLELTDKPEVEAQVEVLGVVHQELEQQELHILGELVEVETPIVQQRPENQMEEQEGLLQIMEEEPEILEELENLHIRD